MVEDDGMLLAFGFDVGTMTVVGVLAVMLYGKNLPEVARQVGRGWADLKKSLSGIQAEFNSVLYSDTPSTSSRRSSTSYSNAIDDYEEQTAPKFEPPPAEPAGSEPTSASA
jgi:sec-independent protein translocase protein TatA